MVIEPVESVVYVCIIEKKIYTYCMTEVLPKGRFGNHFFLNVAVSILAEKHNLQCKYSSPKEMSALGVPLFSGDKKYDTTIDLHKENYNDVLNMAELSSNLLPRDFLQSKLISNRIYAYLNEPKVKENIILKNPCKERYNTNNDVFIHVRVADAKKFNPGAKYYLKAIQNISHYDTIFLSSDNRYDSIVKEIVKKYPTIQIINLDSINTIQFASTCKHVILSHGTFSAIIGYLAFCSNVSYPDYAWASRMWHGDVFSIDGWNRILKK